MQYFTVAQRTESDSKISDDGGDDIGLINHQSDYFCVNEAV